MDNVVAFAPKPKPLPHGVREYLEIFETFEPLNSAIRKSSNPAAYCATFLTMLLLGQGREVAAEILRELEQKLPGCYQDE